MIEVYPDFESLSQAAAALFADRAQLAVAARGRFSVALSGGNTPRRTYELLSLAPHRDAVAWDRVHVFWGDERCVSLNDPLSNAHMAREALLQHVPIRPEQIHPLACRAAPEEAAKEYENLLRKFFAGSRPNFDLVLLGLGENGHTASLFPGTQVLEEQERWTAAVYVAEQDLYRVTLTAPVINAATMVAFLVSGASKAKVLHEVLHGRREPQRLPAQLIHPEGGALCWLVDQAAAAGLEY
jgi:6-phosphogluconolactonase